MEYEGPWMQDMIDELAVHYPARRFSAANILSYESYWRLEVANGDTLSGLRDWIMHVVDGEEG